jgi:hypothetical protein
LKSSLGSLWGHGLPDVASSPAQDGQQCPVLKLPNQIVMAGHRRSWLSLQGQWYTPNHVQVATFDQGFFGSFMWYSKPIQMNLNIRLESSGQIAIRSKTYTDSGMRQLYKWSAKGTLTGNTSKSGTPANSSAMNIVLLDCVGNLMYVVRKTDIYNLTVYSRDGDPLTSAWVEQPVLRLQFADLRNKHYLIAKAEAPGIGANISETEIPKKADYPILPFEIKFAEGGFGNSSLLMEPQNRWVVAAAVQAYAIYEGEKDFLPWEAITLAWLIFAVSLLVVVVVLFLTCFTIFRAVYPHDDDLIKQHYGKISENPWFLVPNRPPTSSTKKQEWRNW